MSTKKVEITCPIGGSDFKLFELVVNQGIDSHLEGFTESTFETDSDRLVLNFDKSELPILIRRLRELAERADGWAFDLEESAK
jgi:hypothetical protein